jgi:hypothetical protein
MGVKFEDTESGIVEERDAGRGRREKTRNTVLTDLKLISTSSSSAGTARMYAGSNEALGRL